MIIIIKATTQPVITNAGEKGLDHLWTRLKGLEVVTALIAFTVRALASCLRCTAICCAAIRRADAAEAAALVDA